MQGTGREVVVLHYECPGAKQMQWDRFAYKVKKTAIKIENKNRKDIQIVILENIVYITENKMIIEISPFFLW